MNPGKQPKVWERRPASILFAARCRFHINPNLNRTPNPTIALPPWSDLITKPIRCAFVRSPIIFIRLSYGISYL